MISMKINDKLSFILAGMREICRTQGYVELFHMRLLLEYFIP